MPPRSTRNAPAASSQLDIFADSADVALRNEVVLALLAQDAGAARQACEALACAFPADACLPAFDALCRHLGELRGAPIGSHDALADECARLAELKPAAQRALGEAATAWLRQQGATLARRGAALPYVATHSEAHAAPLYLQAHDWAAVVEAVNTIESWRRIPAPLGWMLSARLRLGEEDACWPLVAELAWLAPKRLAEVLATSGSPLLARLLKAWDGDWTGDEPPQGLAWFPAWLLCEVPSLAPRLAEAQASRDQAPERGLRLMVELIGLERQGRQSELLQRRRALRDLSEPLWAAYIARR